MLRVGQGAIDRLRAQLDQLLAALQLRERAGHIEASSLALEPLLREVYRESEWSALQKGLDIRLEPSAARIMSDPLLLRAVVRNLLNNAIKYTEPGGRILLGCPALSRVHSDRRHRYRRRHLRGTTAENFRSICPFRRFAERRIGNWPFHCATSRRNAWPPRRRLLVLFVAPILNFCQANSRLGALVTFGMPAFAPPRPQRGRKALSW